jgi:hypothetical protein
LPSEFYVDFGLPGVVVLSFLFGMFVRLCDDYFMHFKRTSDTLGQVFVSTVAGYIFIILRGSLVGTLGPVLLSLFIAGVCHRYSTAPVLVSPDEDPPADDEDEPIAFLKSPKRQFGGQF